MNMSMTVSHVGFGNLLLCPPAPKAPLHFLLYEDYFEYSNCVVLCLSLNFSLEYSCSEDVHLL